MKRKSDNYEKFLQGDSEHLHKTSRDNRADLLKMCYTLDRKVSLHEVMMVLKLTHRLNSTWMRNSGGIRLVWACVYGGKWGLSRRHTFRDDIHGTGFVLSERPPDGDMGQSFNFKHPKEEPERWAVRVHAAVAKDPHLGAHSQLPGL